MDCKEIFIFIWTPIINKLIVNEYLLYVKSEQDNDVFVFHLNIILSSKDFSKYVQNNCTNLNYK